MIAQFVRGFLEQVGRIGMLQRRSGIFMHARRFENVSAIDELATEIAGLAADAHHLLGVPIVRLQLIVGYAPIAHRQIGGEFRGAVLLGKMRSQVEDTRQKAEAHAGPMLARASHAGTGMERAVLADGNRRIAGRMPVRDGLFGDVLHHAQADVIVQFVHVHGIVGEVTRSAALQRQHAGGCAGDELLRHGKSGPAAAHDGDIYGFEIGHSA